MKGLPKRKDAEAARVLREHYRLFPDDLRVMDKLVGLLRRTGGREEAIRILRRYFSERMP